MGLWDFVIADGVAIEDSTKTLGRSSKLSLKDLRRSATWRKLCVLVRVKPDMTSSPSGEYDGVTNTIGLNRLTSKGRFGSHWLIASYLRF